MRIGGAGKENAAVRGSLDQGAVMADAFIGIYLRFFFLLTPFFALSTFLALTETFDMPRRRRLALRVTGAVFAAAACLLLFGNALFTLFGITLDAFRVGAGALLFLSGVSLVRGEEPSPRLLEGDTAVVPLAIPIVVGPATTGALLVKSAETAEAVRARGMDWTFIAAEGAGVVCAIATVGAMLYLSAYIQRFIGRRGLSILSKLTGLALTAMSAQMIMAGAKNFIASAP